jgi:methanogen homoaconitase small subunit
MTRVWKFGSDVDTDQIVPGRYAPYMRPDADVGEAAFIEARPEFAQNARPGDIIIAASNFGCGSSREYAVTALKRRQVGAIVALSYARIFYRNGINLGIPLYIAPEVVQGVQDGAEVELDLVNQILVANGQTYALPPMPKFAQEIISAGGVVPYVKTHGRFPGE